MNTRQAIQQIKADLLLAATKDPEFMMRFFKAGKGEYAEGDRFVGVTVPNQRRIARQYADLSLSGIRTLLKSAIHEHRLTGLFILVGQFQKSKDVDERTQLKDFYLEMRSRVNNWDLVDSSAHKILGAWLRDQPKKERAILTQLSKSDVLWDRRIAVIATFWFISKGEFDDMMRLAKRLLHDEHDLMHKAIGWGLREVGKKDKAVLTDFLDDHAAVMPRTMLRYAIERLSASERKRYMNVATGK